jgi:LuxR family maltose regulon positive regulatory protein
LASSDCDSGPGRPRLIDRRALLAALDRAVACKVTIISAPAGSGKTSLLRTWADRPGRPHRLAVVPVRRDQQDGQQFWLALLSAVRRTNETAGRAEPPTATPDFNGQAMVDRVLAELADNGDAIILVIDDLHELHSPEAFDQLTSLLTNLPPHVHAVLTTRHDLRLRLHRLRLAGELAEIRAVDLRFTERETRELLDAAGIALSEDAAARLHQRTEGWAAGLRLAALSLAVHPDPERFVAEFSGSDRTVAEYLIAEMLERRPVDVQQLLLRTSLLDQVNGELADLLTGRNGSERLLLQLEDANAFVVSVDAERTWFRYHHLFADLLRLELRRTWPEEVPALHRRAAAWFLRQGMVAEAIRHTQAAGDWSDAARLLADHAFSLMLDGQAQTLQALLRAFPQGADHPGLALVHASVDVVQGRLDETAAHLAVAETYALTASPDRLPRLRVAIALVKLSLARRRGHLAGVRELVEFLDAPLTGQSEEDIALGNDLRAAALMNLGIVEAWSLGVPDGERHLLEGALLARKIGRPYLEVSCLAELGQASKFRSFATVRSRCQEAVALAERHGWAREPMISPALVTLASTMIWAGEFDEGERWLQRTEQALQSDAGPAMRLLLHLVTGMLHAGRGHHQKALEEFSAAGHMQSWSGSHTLVSQVTGWILATQARLGMPDVARAALARLPDEQAGSGEVRNARAVIGLADGDPQAALDALHDVLDRTAPVIGDITVIEAHLLAAHAHRQLGDRPATNRSVELALALAEPDGLVLPFAMTGARPLLEELPRHETAHAALLIAILDVGHGSSPTAHDVSSSSTPTEELSPSELRVLRYLPTNLSRPEIAGQLSVSVNTVNTHLRNIYAKLRTSNRSSTVQRARELRLLSAAVPDGPAVTGARRTPSRLGRRSAR